MAGPLRKDLSAQNCTQGALQILRYDDDDDDITTTTTTMMMIMMMKMKAAASGVYCG